MLVRELHKNNIEVILDVVFNHTREGNHYGPTVSFKGLDNNIYYMLAPKPEFYMDFTGCGNTMNCNHPVVRKFILDCLRYWVTEMHVDGFRFDLAAVFAIDVDQQEKGKTPIIHEIETDPVLSRIKLIAEPWSITQYRLGSFSDRRWAEWNGKFRDTVRKWVKGDAGVASELGARVTGSYDLFAKRRGRPADPYPQHQLRHLPRRLHAQRPRLVQREAQRAERREQPRRGQRQRKLELRLRGLRRAVRPARRGEGRGSRISVASRSRIA